MIFRQYEAIIRQLKTETRRTSTKDTYKVNHVYSVVPKRAQPTVWYMFPTDKYDRPLDFICYAHDTYTDSTRQVTIWESAHKELFTIDHLPHPEAHLRNMGFKPLRIRILSKHWEPLHVIDEAGAIAEGIREVYSAETTTHRRYMHDLSDAMYLTAVEAYAHLWDSINGKSKQYCWAANPQVQVHKFKLVTE